MSLLPPPRFLLDAKDLDQLSQHSITHIVSIHESPQPFIPVRTGWACHKRQPTQIADLGYYFGTNNRFWEAAGWETSLMNGQPTGKFSSATSLSDGELRKNT